MGLFGKAKAVTAPEPEPELDVGEGEAEDACVSVAREQPQGIRWQRAHETVALTADGASAYGDSCFRCAKGDVVLQRGQHFAEFTIVAGRRLMLGVVRPGWDVDGLGTGSTEQQCHEVVGHAFYSSADGRCFPGNAEWRGAQAARAGDCIGLLIDLDMGSMTLCKNGERLGLMLPEGSLTGEFVWAVGMVRSPRGDCVRIVSAPVPDCLKLKLSKKEKNRLTAHKAKEKQKLQPEQPESAGPSGAFVWAHPTITLSECGGGSEARSSHGYRAAASNEVLRDGQHFAEFVVSYVGPACIPAPDRNSSGSRENAGVNLLLGLIRPQWDVELGEEPEEVDGHCFFNCRSGCCFPGRASWAGLEPLTNARSSVQAESESTAEVDAPMRLGMLLDLDAGTLAIYKNGRRLGVMAEGLSGEYCWAVSMLGDQGECVTITSTSNQTPADVEAEADQISAPQAAAEHAHALQVAEVARAKQLHAQRAAEMATAALTSAAVSAYSQQLLLRFDVCNPDLIASEQAGGTSVCKTDYGNGRLSGYRTAASASIMQTGVHFAEFTIEAEYIVYIGVIGGSWDVSAGRDAHLQDGHYFWESLHGKRFPLPSLPPTDRPSSFKDIDKDAVLALTSADHQYEQSDDQTAHQRQSQLLLTAAAAGDAEAVRRSLEAGADPRVTDSNGWNAIVLAIRCNNVNVLEALWGASQPQSKSHAESGSESDEESGSDSETGSQSASETEAPAASSDLVITSPEQQERSCRWHDEVAKLLTSVDRWGRTPMMYAAMLHHQLWPHDAAEGETESLEWLKSKLGLTLGAAPADAAEVDWRLKNNIGGDWEGRQGAMSKGDRIGMSLDLEQGSLTLYKNDTLLGVMADSIRDTSSGSVPLAQSRDGWRWAVSLMRPGDSVHIEAFESPEAAAAAAAAKKARP